MPLRDTTAAAERIQVELWAAMSPIEKFCLVSAISRNVQELSLAGIRRRHPDATNDELRFHLAVAKLGDELARATYPHTYRLIRSRR
jgi:hypothetical protein